MLFDENRNRLVTFTRLIAIASLSGCGFAFADDHSESYRWNSASHTPTTKADGKHWEWMRKRTSAKAPS